MYAKLLDCTLRDGAYLIDKQFGEENIRGIINGLLDARIDFIEIGFFQDTGQGDGKTVFLNSNEALKYVPCDKKNSLFTVLADCSRYDIDNLDDRMDNSIDAIRECFFKSEITKAIENCRRIKEKGYLVFVQPVDILGYSDKEILDLIEMVNKIEPYCLSIVDTFGSMYQEDLHRIFELINHNLTETCKIGFHSHNNMQLSNALSQEFLRISEGKREIVIDGTLSGMGRGAGNTPTELVAQYMISKFKCGYDMDALLDVIDSYMQNIRTRCSWGYSMPYFVAGCYGAHVNNVAFLQEKNGICSKDIRYILNKLGALERKRYDYVLLEKIYLDYLKSDIDDEQTLNQLIEKLSQKKILMLAPGNTINIYRHKIIEFIEKENPIVISINFIPQFISVNYLYISNIKRYELCKNTDSFEEISKIITSNLPVKNLDNYCRVSFTRFVKCGWQYMDNSALMLLRLLDFLSVSSIYMAGFDGYDANREGNFYKDVFENAKTTENSILLNREITEMLEDFINTRNNKNVPLVFLTPSRFSKIEGLKGETV